MVFFSGASLFLTDVVSSARLFEIKLEVPLLYIFACYVHLFRKHFVRILKLQKKFGQLLTNNITNEIKFLERFGEIQLNLCCSNS